MTTSWYRVVVIFFGAVILTACGGSESSNIGTSASAFGIEGTGGCDPACANRFSNPVPAISAIEVIAPGGRYGQGAPACVLVGTLDFTLSLFGTGFSTASVVEWNGSARPTTLGTTPYYSYLSAQISAGDVAVAGSVAITVSNPAPGGGRSNAAAFTIAPVLGASDIAVDPTGQFAYATIHDCGALGVGNGSVSIYRIDTTTGMLTSIGLVPSGDWGANSIAIRPDGRFAYVGSDSDSGDGSSGSGGVSVFTADSTTGILTLTGFTSSPCTTGPGSCTPWSIAMHPSGRFLYVANEGGFEPTSVSMYSIDATTGNLTLIGLVGTGGRAQAVAVDPSGRFAYVFNQTYAPLPASVAMYTINATTGNLTLIGTMVSDVAAPAGGIIVDPTGKFVYVTNRDSSDVAMYAINQTTGALATIGRVAAGSAPVGAAVYPTGKFMYVANSGSNDISMYALDATTGALTSLGRVAGGISPGAMTVDPAGKFAYVTNSNNVLIYRIDATTGALTLVGTVGI